MYSIIANHELMCAYKITAARQVIYVFLPRLPLYVSSLPLYGRFYRDQRHSESCLEFLIDNIISSAYLALQEEAKGLPSVAAADSHTGSCQFLAHMSLAGCF